MKHLLLALCLLAVPLRAQQGPQDLHSFFSPNGGCTQAVVDQLNGAKKQVLVQAYSFTSTPIARALVDAKHRGVDVQVILDKSQRGERYSSATFLALETLSIALHHPGEVTVFARPIIHESLGLHSWIQLVSYEAGSCHEGFSQRSSIPDTGHIELNGIS